MLLSIYLFIYISTAIELPQFRNSCYQCLQSGLTSNGTLPRFFCSGPFSNRCFNASTDLNRNCSLGNLTDYMQCNVSQSKCVVTVGNPIANTVINSTESTQDWIIINDKNMGVSEWFNQSYEVRPGSRCQFLITNALSDYSQKMFSNFTLQ